MQMTYQKIASAQEIYRHRANQEIDSLRLKIAKGRELSKAYTDAMQEAAQSNNKFEVSGQAKTMREARLENEKQIKAMMNRIELLLQDITEKKYNAGERMYTRNINLQNQFGYNEKAPSWTSLSESQRRVYCAMVED